MANIRFSFNDKKPESKNCFICYDRYNPELDPTIHNLALMLAEDLRSYGVNVSGYFPTQNPQVFVDALNNSEYVFVLVSANLNNSPLYGKEFKQADDLKDQGKIRGVYTILCEGSQSILPYNYQGKVALAFTDIIKGLTSSDQSLIRGNYANLFERYVLKALGLSAENKIQSVSHCAPK